MDRDTAAQSFVFIIVLQAIGLAGLLAGPAEAETGPPRVISLQREATPVLRTDFEGDPVPLELPHHSLAEGAGREGGRAITAEVKQKEKTRGFNVPFEGEKGNLLKLTFWARSDSRVRCAVWIHKDGASRRRSTTVDHVTDEWMRITATTRIRTNKPGRFQVLVPSSWSAPPGRAWVDDLRLERVEQAGQRDYPAMALDDSGTPWVSYVAFDGESDTLNLARRADGGLRTVGRLAGPGLIHQPGMARDGSGTLWTVWSQHKGDGWGLYARAIRDGEIGEGRVTLVEPSGNHVFADVAADRRGRVWVAWQAFEGGYSRIYTCYYAPDAGEWSEPIRVTNHDGGGSWKPQLAFGRGDAAWIAFDQATDGEFDVKLARVRPGGSVETQAVADGPAYQAAASIASTPGGEAFYVSWERGNKRWGMDTRNGPLIGLNSNKDLETARIDAGSREIERLPDAKPLVAQFAEVPNNTRALRPNLPRIAVDGSGTPWMAARYATSRAGNSYKVWRIVLMRYDRDRGQWSEPIELPNSTFSQNRRCRFARTADGALWLTWPSDGRASTKPGLADVYLARIGPDLAMTYPEEAPSFPDPERGPRDDPAKDTPLRPRAERDEFTFNGKTYKLYWGDFHRHTDLSPDGTLHDGSITEQFRYAYECGELDFLGTSDHTDIGPGHYTVYEWWQTQKLADVFHNPGFFVGFYAYEREQRWPWGHRNIIFAERGGPVVYIQRNTYRQSRWGQRYTVGKGKREIRPQELWKILDQADNPVAVVSHTGGDKRMGTNWELYEKIDHSVENLVEIYQGKRVSYESMDAPQPRVGLSPGEKGRRLDARKKKGTYQHALKQGLRLGIFASSDHFSTNVSYGGVYAPKFSRESLVKSLNARRTLGATDKIFLHYTCNGKLMGSELTTDEKPTLKVHAEGTAPIRRLTILRNEKVYKQYKPDGKRKLSVSFTDENPAKGVNRYYVRVYQEDGNMAWASPVWVEYKP